MSDEQAPAAPDPVTERALAAIQAALPDAVVASELEGLHPWIEVTTDALRDCITLLRDADKVKMDCLHLITGVDLPSKKSDHVMEVLYHLCSYSHLEAPEYFKREGKRDPWICLKVRVPFEKPEVPSIMDIHTGADWHERETFDLVGIKFTGRPDLRRILLPEDWPGHPLQKGWEYPVSYHGVPILPPEAL